MLQSNFVKHMVSWRNETATKLLFPKLLQVNSLYPMHMKRQVPRTVICQRQVFVLLVDLFHSVPVFS